MEITTMISETSFARSYTSFWLDYTPWINNFTSSVNKGLIDRIDLPFTLNDDPLHRSINNVVSFTLFKNIILLNEDDLEKSFKEASKIMINYLGNGLDSYILTDNYKKLIFEQTNRLIKRYKAKNVIFYPQFSGCGILYSCQGDLLYSKTLVEIKAGERGILSSDIKQIIVYCALNWLSTNKYEIDTVELYNPRQGILWQSKLKDLVLSISNLPVEDLFDQIGKFLYDLSEDIEL